MNKLTDYKTSYPKETNFQHYEKEIREIGELGYIAVVDGKPVSCGSVSFDCCSCMFNQSTCDDELINWLYAEYKEDYSITEAEFSFLKAIDTGFIVRDNHNNLIWFENTPSKIDGVWTDNGGDVVKLNFIKKLHFPFIKYEGQCWSVVDLVQMEVKNCGNS